MKHFKIYHKGLSYAVDEYANSKKEAIANYRSRWDLEGKHLNLVCYEA